MKMKKNKIASYDEIPLIVDCGYVARLLGCSVDLVYKLCANGDIKAFRVGNLWRIKREDLKKFIDGE